MAKRYSHNTHLLHVQLVLSNERTQLQESANEDGAFPRFSAFPEVLDRSDFRLREFKMAATGKSLTCNQIVLKHGRRFRCRPDKRMASTASRYFTHVI